MQIVCDDYFARILAAMIMAENIAPSMPMAATMPFYCF